MENPEPLPCCEMPRFHEPNALDRVFLALDDAWARIGMPGVDIHLHLEMSGRIDVAGLHEAVAATATLYPALNARLKRGGWLRRPRWELAALSDYSQVYDIEQVTIENAAAERAWSEAALASRIDWSRHAPLKIALLHRNDGDDTVVVRWPHALMDARGGATIIEEIAAQYRAMRGMSPGERRAYRLGLVSRGDELRRDFGTLDAKKTREARAQRRVRQSGDVLRVWEPAAELRGGSMRIALRRFSQEQAEQVQRNALRECGLARHADFIRASAVEAVATLLPRDRRAGASITSLHMIDNRRRRDPGPVCHNVFSTFPVWIPAELATDRVAVADCFRDTALHAIETEDMPRRLAQLTRLAALPTALLSMILAASLRSRRSWLPIGLTNAPTLPLGFMGDFSRPVRDFCGATLVNVYGVRPPTIRSSFGVNINAALGRMNVVVTYAEPRVEPAQVNRFLEGFSAAILSECG